MKVAVCQIKPEFGAVERNLAGAKNCLAGTDADLVVLPELFNTGYQFRDREEAFALGEDLSGPTVSWAGENAAHIGAWICGGFAERAGEKVFNSAFLAGPEGQVHIYRKVHLFNRETLCFDPGDLGFPVFDIGIAKVGMMVCFDWIFPESARQLALSGAQVLLHPSNLVLPYCQRAMVTRCLENGVFAITANRVGTESRIEGESLTFTGASQITAPFGEILAQGSREGVERIERVIEPSEALEKRVNTFNDLFDDRRVEYYPALSKDEK